MYDFLSDLINIPEGASDVMVSGSIMLTLICIIFLLWCVSRLFKP